jgi:hypothetical protein
MIDPDPIRERFIQLSLHLAERERRLLAAVEVRACGYGGVAAVSRATGLAASTIGRGLKELGGEASVALGREDGQAVAAGRWWSATPTCSPI